MTPDLHQKLMAQLETNPPPEYTRTHQKSNPWKVGQHIHGVLTGALLGIVDACSPTMWANFHWAHIGGGMFIFDYDLGPKYQIARADAPPAFTVGSRIFNRYKEGDGHRFTLNGVVVRMAIGQFGAPLGALDNRDFVTDNDLSYGRMTVGQRSKAAAS